MAKSGRRSDCPVNVALELLGDRWTLLIVRDLLFTDRTHYRAFLESSEGISTNILADRLKMLECAGIVTKRGDPTNRSRRNYRLTRKGLDLLPVVIDLILWSAEYELPELKRSAMIRRLRNDRPAVEREIRARHEA